MPEIETGGNGGNVMERPWLQHYPPGVPADIDPSRYPSLVAMFEESFQAHRRQATPASAWARP